jgi:hypothetical protein
LLEEEKKSKQMLLENLKFTFTPVHYEQSKFQHNTTFIYL